MRFLTPFLLYFSLFSAAANAAAPAPVKLEPVKVSEHAWYVQGLPGGPAGAFPSRRRVGA